jgi:hypothetical protein
MTFTSDGANTTIAFDGSFSVELVGIGDFHTLHMSDFLFA